MNKKNMWLLTIILIIVIASVSTYWLLNKQSNYVDKKISDNNVAGGNITQIINDNHNQTKNNYEYFASILLGAPTDKSVTINLIPLSDIQAYIEYGTKSGSYSSRTTIFNINASSPTEIQLDGLQSNTQYYYRFQYKKNGEYLTSQEHTFHTARPKGSTFTFAIEADPHLDEQSDPEIYKQTLTNILSDKPDFLIDLGDTFMSEKLPVKGYEAIEERHILFRKYLNVTGADVPLFLALGNHEGESGWELNGTENNLAVVATNIRKQYYPNPLPDDFYSGNSYNEEFVGLREDYYSFEWGDALIVVLDPYWYTENKPNSDGWGWTLGKNQYDWFKTTLENSDARYKLVFAHQLVGGNNQGRGGVEEAGLFEWGGNNLDGSYGFDKYRPGWGKPIHQLLVENGVDIFFKGHDHFFAKQELDDVIYQTLPQPSHPGSKVNTAEEYGYLSGEILGGSGYLRVNVSEVELKVEFVRYNGVTVYSYVI